MKKIYSLFILSTIILFSCINDEDLVQNEREVASLSDLELSIDNKSTGFKLISKREIKETEIPSLKLITVNSTYERSVPIYRYLYYNTSANIDHLYTTTNSSKLSHDSRSYTQEDYQDFNLMPFSMGQITQPLYRHRSTISNNHMLSTNSSVSSFTNEELVGYIFKEQQIGTVPLLEYYSSQRNSYLYPSTKGEIENWLPYHDTDFQYTKTLGYVYSGRTLDSKKTPTQFIFENADKWTSYPTSITLALKVREVDTYWELTYSVDMLKAGASVTLPITNSYIVVSADIIIKSNINNGWVTNTFTDVTKPQDYYFESMGVWGSIIINLERNISGYNAIYNFYYDFPVGN